MEPNSPTQPSYRLSDHVFAGCTGREVVLLDLRKDEYLAIAEGALAALPQFVDGWPRGDSPEHSIGPSDTGAVNELLQSLLSQDLIVRRSGAAESGSRRRPSAPTAAAVSFLDGVGTPTVGTVAQVLRASLVAQMWLTFLPLQTVVQRLQMAPKKGDASAKSIANAIKFSKSYCSVRPLIFRAQTKCLLDSLTMSIFLSSRGVRSSVVFGVRTQPFAAHCWVQLEDTVLNDELDHVLTYQPILAT